MFYFCSPSVSIDLEYLFPPSVCVSCYLRARFSHTPSCSGGEPADGEEIITRKNGFLASPFFLSLLASFVSFWFSDSIPHVSMSPSRCASSRSRWIFPLRYLFLGVFFLDVSVFFLMSRSFSSEPRWLSTTCILFLVASFLPVLFHVCRKSHGHVLPHYFCCFGYVCQVRACDRQLHAIKRLKRQL